MSNPVLPGDMPVFSVRPSDAHFFQDPYPYYRKMHALNAPFIWSEYGHVCFASFEAVNSILRDRRFGRQITHVMDRGAAGLPEIPPHLESFYTFEANSMLELEPPGHTRLRKLVNRAFVSRHIEQKAENIRGLCHRLIDDFPQNEPFDLLTAYCEKIPVIVIADLLGVPRDMADQLLVWSHKMVAMYQFNRTRIIEDEAVTATAEFSHYIRKLALERRSNPRDDLITALAEAESSGDHLTMDELVTTVILLLNAGHEATVHALGNSVNVILENRLDPSRLFESPKTTQKAIEELLRIDPPLHMFTRYVLEDLEYSGIKLKKGQTVGLLLGAANHDPVQYENPELFDVERGGEGHVSFGAGIHFCLGAPLARLEMTIALPALFQRIGNLRLFEKPCYSDRFHFHGLERLTVSRQS